MSVGAWFASDAATWFQAVGTVGAFAVGIGVFRREVNDRHDKEVRLKRDQARRVSVSQPRGGRISMSAGSADDTRKTKRDFTVTVANHSTESVNSCRVRITLDSNVLVEPCIPVLRDVGRVLPGVSAPATFVIRTETYHEVKPRRLEAQAELLFTDAAGVRWHRDIEHNLREVASADPW